MGVTIVRGDITDQDVDAIVNAANTELAGGSGVCGRIYERAGWEQMAGACAAVGPCPTGGARTTPGFALAARWVVHAVGPVWRGGQAGEEDLLRRAYRSALREGEQAGASSMAFPVLSTGVYGYPLDAGCRVAFETLRDTPTSIADVRIVAFDDATWRAFEQLGAVGAGRAVAWEGDDYQARFDRLAASGADVHGEATFVRAYEPRSVLDAGCGTGRVAIELARHGIEVVGVDVDPSMIATARRLAPQLTWVEHDLTTLELGRTFDVVVLAGNVPLFTPPGTQAQLVASAARHVAPGGCLVAGFSVDRGYGIDEWDAHATAAGLVLAERFATWDRAPWQAGGAYAVSVHRPA
jgi:O-acetyl-ADP-ribose deacetylase (regulator of RNase III)/2-polyprenyl-3-methyl-5-hydroxy-6-metoxy-1,4-benzoquinol methylase